MYTDDTHLTYASGNAHDIQTNLIADLENIHYWLRANKLILNVNKTTFMLIGSWQRLSAMTVSPTFAINDCQLRKFLMLHHSELPFDADVGYLFKPLRWQNAARLHEIGKATIVYKSLLGSPPENLCSRFTTRELASNLRNSDLNFAFHCHGKMNTKIDFATGERRYSLEQSPS